MARSTGLDAQLGLAEEETWGTFVTPTDFLMFLQEGFKRSAGRDEAEGLRAGEYALHEDDWEEGRVGVDGDFTLEWPDRGTALLVKHMLGSLSTSQPDDTGDPNVFEHVGTPGPLDGQSLAFQAGRPDRGGVVRPFSYSGCKITEWEISNEIDGYLLATINVDGRDESRAEPLAAKSFIASQRKLHWAGGFVEVAGVEVPVSSISLKGVNQLRTERYFMSDGGSQLKDEQLEGSALRDYTGDFDCEWDGANGLYDLYVNGTPATLVAKWVGGVIAGGSGSFKFGLTVSIPVARFDGETPTTDGADAIEQTLPFKALSNGTDPVVEFTVTDNVATP